MAALDGWSASGEAPSPGELLAAIVDSTDDAIVSKDLRGTITSWNRGAERLFGYTAQEAIGQSITMLIPPERLDEELDILERLKRGERIDHFETVRRRKDGTSVDISLTISPIRDAQGRIVGASKVARDISDRKRGQGVASLLAAIVDSSDDAIISKDLNGVITSWNAGARRLFGYTAEEVIGKPIAILFPPDRLDEEPGILDRIKRGDRVDHFETVRVRKDGTPLDISLTISPVKDADGRVVGASKVARDISERKRTEAELQQYRHHLEKLVEHRTAELTLSHQRLRASERLSSLGTLSAGLGHDIGNVMMPLSAHLRALQTKFGVSSKLLSEHFEAISTSIEYLQNLSNGLRLLSVDPETRQEFGGSVDLNAWWSETQPLLKTATSGKTRLEREFAPGLPPLALPQHLLTQAVFNLVQNAAQAIAAMNAEAQTPVAGRVLIGAALAGPQGMVRLWVADNGPGMTPEVRDHCLEAFYTTKTRGISTGLGLAVVHGIVQSGRGLLEIETAPGQGTTFSLMLPAAAPKPKAAPASGPLAVVNVGNARVRAVVAYELELLNIPVANGRGDGAARAGLLVIDDSPDRRAAADDFLAQQPDGRVVIVGCEPSTLDVDDSRIVEVGPAVKRDALRQALQAAVKQARIP